jgi:uncharacterized membrane protein
MPTKPRPDDDREARVAVAGHPIHPMLVTFPIAFLLAMVPVDLAWILTGDEFWPRLGLWLAGAGFFMGAVAGIAGTIELLAIPGVRRRGASWSHFVAAVTLISVAFANWYLRIADPAALIVPLGLSLSVLGAVLTGVAGWLGGNLVFEHQIGVVHDDGD